MDKPILYLLGFGIVVEYTILISGDLSFSRPLAHPIIGTLIGVAVGIGAVRVLAVNRIKNDNDRSTRW